MNAKNRTATSPVASTKPLAERRCRTCPNMFVPKHEHNKFCRTCHKAWYQENYGVPCIDCKTYYLPPHSFKKSRGKCEKCLNEEELTYWQRVGLAETAPADRLAALVQKTKECYLNAMPLPEGVTVYRVDGRHITVLIMAGQKKHSSNFSLPKTKEGG